MSNPAFNEPATLTLTKPIGYVELEYRAIVRDLAQVVKNSKTGADPEKTLALARDVDARMDKLKNRIKP